MNVVRRMLAVNQERQRRREAQLPEFAIGVAPPRANPSPRLHPCQKASNGPIPLKPLILFAAKIPYECMITALMAGTNLKDRHEILEIQRQAIDKIHPPEMRITLLESLREKEHWNMIESKCRTAFRNLVSRWLFKRYSTNRLNTEDPATLSEPIQPIHVFDSTARGTYVFEAASLRKSMERDLNYCDWLFPEPFHPKNPLTNLPFHMGHRIYLLQQLRSYNQGSWILEGYHRTKWNLKAFRDIFLVPLKTRALQDICRNPTSEETIDYMIEYIEDHYEYHQIHRPEILIILKWAVKNASMDPYMLEWLQSFKQYYSVQIIYGEHFLENNTTLQATLYGVTRHLFRQIKTINRLAKLRNHAILERRRERSVEPVSPISAVQDSPSPLSNLLISTPPQLFDFGSMTIEILTERISLTIDEWNHANP
jgi:hypothetical protein